jgi:predicted RNA-binding protein with PIN domain
METNTQTNNKSEKGNYYKEKYGKNRKGDKEEKIKKEIEELGVTSDVEHIKQKVDAPLRKILKALVLNEKDKDKAITYLQSFLDRKTERKKKKLERLENEMKDLDLSKIETLKSKGYKERKAVKALKKNDNDLDKAIEFLESKTKNRKEKMEAKYKKYLPDDTEFDWEKFKAVKKEKNQEKKLAKYKKFFPDDTEIDKEKFKKCKLELRIQKEKEKLERDQYLINEIGNHTFTQLYLDGNNMLFVDDILRKLCLNKNVAGAAKKLSEAVEIYSKQEKLNTILIFDILKECFEKDEDGVKFQVCSARPDFETSDDALVEWAGGLSASAMESILFVTSDRALQTRLIRKGAKYLMKSGVWFKLMKAKITDEVYSKLFD